MNVNVSGSWISPIGLNVNVSGSWIAWGKAYVLHNGEWVSFYNTVPSPTITPSDESFCTDDVPTYQVSVDIGFPLGMSSVSLSRDNVFLTMVTPTSNPYLDTSIPDANNYEYEAVGTIGGIDSDPGINSVDVENPCL